MAMEEKFGRHRAEVKTLAGGVWRGPMKATAAFAEIQKSVEGFSPKPKAAARVCWW